MKIRNGFVSNSSSSSFIINKNISPAEFIYKVIDFVYNNKKEIFGEDWEKETGPFFIQQKENAKKLMDNNDFSPVVFTGTTNEETFVCFDNKRLVVHTCNNEPWDSILEEADLNSWHNNGDYEKYIEIDREMLFVDLEDFEKLNKINKWDKVLRQFQESCGPLIGGINNLIDN